MSTIAQRRKTAGWITNDTRMDLVTLGKLRPGHIAGEKCGCCRSFNDRCRRHDFPTGKNNYCNDFMARLKAGLGIA